jgi:hypothetical protein
VYNHRCSTFANIQIKDVWCKKQVVSVLFLDIEGTFLNTVNERLIHNLRLRKVPIKIVEFIKNLLHRQSTTLRFNDFTSDRIALDNRIGQGNPLLMILYQYYKVDILNIPNGLNKTAAVYVDDAILVATVSDFNQTHNILRDMVIRPGGVIECSNVNELYSQV